MLVHFNLLHVGNSIQLPVEKTANCFLNGSFLATFCLFSSFQNNWRKQINVRCNSLPMTGFEPLASEATALPTEPQPLPETANCLYLRPLCDWNPRHIPHTSVPCTPFWVVDKVWAFKKYFWNCYLARISDLHPPPIFNYFFSSNGFHISLDGWQWDQIWQNFATLAKF